MTRSRNDGYTSSVGRSSVTGKQLVSSNNDSTGSNNVKSFDSPHQTIECEHKERWTEQSESESSQQAESSQRKESTAPTASTEVRTHVVEKENIAAGTTVASKEKSDYNAAHIKVLNSLSDLSSENDNTVPIAEYSSESVHTECSPETMETLHRKCAMFARKIAQLESDLQASGAEHDGERGEARRGEDRGGDRDEVNRGDFTHVNQGEDKNGKLGLEGRSLKRSLMDDLVTEHVDDIEESVEGSIGGFDSIYPTGIDDPMGPTDNPIGPVPLNSRRILIEWDQEHVWRDSMPPRPSHSSSYSPQDKSTSPMRFFNRKDNIKHSSRSRNISPISPKSLTNTSSESSNISRKSLKIFAVESPTHSHANSRTNSNTNSNLNSPINSVNKRSGRGVGGRGGLILRGLSPPPPRMRSIAIGASRKSSNPVNNEDSSSSSSLIRNPISDASSAMSSTSRNGSSSGPKGLSKGSLKKKCFCSNIRIDSVDALPREALHLQAQDGSMIDLALGGDAERNANRNVKKDVKKGVDKSVERGVGSSTEEEGEEGEKGEKGEGIEEQEGEGEGGDESGDINALCSFCQDYGDSLLNHSNLYDDDRGLLVHELLSELTTALNLKAALSSDLTESNSSLTASNTALSENNTALELKVLQLEGFIAVTRQAASSSFSSPTGSKEMKESMLLTGELFQECSRLRGQVLDLERKMKITEEEKNSIINNVPSAIKTMHSEGVHRPLRSSDAYLFRDMRDKDGRERDTLAPDSESSTPTTRTPSIRLTQEPADRTPNGAPERPLGGTPNGVSYGGQNGAPDRGLEGGPRISDPSSSDGCATQTQTSPGLGSDSVAQDLKRQALNEIQMIKSDLESKLAECIYKRKGRDETVGTFITLKLELVDEISKAREEKITVNYSGDVSPHKGREGERKEEKGESKVERGESQADDMQKKLRYLMDKVHELNHIALERDAEFEVLARGMESKIQVLSSALFLALGVTEVHRQCGDDADRDRGVVDGHIGGPLALSMSHAVIAPSLVASPVPSASIQTVVSSGSQRLDTVPSSSSSSSPSSASDMKSTPSDDSDPSASSAVDPSCSSDRTTCPSLPSPTDPSSPSSFPSSPSYSPSSRNAHSSSSSSPLPTTTPFFAPFPGPNHPHPDDTEYTVNETKLVPKSMEKQKTGKNAKERGRRREKMVVVNE